MNKYTFIFEFKGGTYVSQILSDNLNFAINKWASNDDYFRKINFFDKEIKILKKEIHNDEPILLRGLSNVWSMYLQIDDFGCLINIVQTV
jgi:hypothetical protein